MKSPLRLVKGAQPVEKKAEPREQRFRYGVAQVWEVSCGPVRRVEADLQVGPPKRRKAS
jgi:hypothetical protein